MKKLLIAVSILLSFSAHAQRTAACKVFEFAELNTYSDADLKSLRDKYETTHKSIGSVAPITPAEVRQDMDDRKNCGEEVQRITRLIESRSSKSKKK